MRLAPLVGPSPELGGDELARTARQRRLPELGEIGQRRLAASRVAVLGAGGLGAPALQYLAAAGVGTIGIIDADAVEPSNLHRQVIHGIGDVGERKTASAAGSLRRLAPDVTVIEHDERLDEGNAAAILGGYDLVLDGADNFATRYAVADACVALGLPLVWGSVLRFDAQLSVFWSSPPDPADAVTLRDVFPEPPPAGSVPSCAEAGVLGAVCGVVGSMMAVEAIKLITGIGDVLLGRLVVVEALTMRISEVPLRAVTKQLTGQPTAQSSAQASAQTLARDRPVETAPPGQPSPLDFDAVRDARGRFVDVREPDEYAVDALPGAVSLPLSELLQLDREPSELVARLHRIAGEHAGTHGSPLNLYCVSSTRARRAARLIASHGIEVRVVQTPELSVLRGPAGASRVDASQGGASA
ncbi:molybdopterin-synthase adenylyltransferase [Pseudoclavibacter sp. AY1F1]|uniref:HesA/MoeB/ThiF family protein n=1 Tax=Pseudoclavibacter sp. AY1F1 TaxID=2080583 RepID=UPI000CE8E870|nr:ThiF family adenylyltransferase [Pseudoclavibacter sp. AY1F1]PPF44909.1 molybdopterin-synthase adenylyltransferase [Pseudoclavibacter sp. AY1F1]